MLRWGASNKNSENLVGILYKTSCANQCRAAGHRRNAGSKTSEAHSCRIIKHTDIQFKVPPKICEHISPFPKNLAASSNESTNLLKNSKASCCSQDDDDDGESAPLTEEGDALLLHSSASCDPIVISLF
uniref:Uncharacterized protein n=1 Tax=Romanomermis culicivorax TaxID=13658 RepID=A0A915KA57_ROMCU